MSCRLILLQAKILNAVIGDLLEANRLLEDTKKNADVQIRVYSLYVRFISFSDAAFATRERVHSQRGTFRLATTQNVEEPQGSKVSPLVWSSKKIQRVVSSTLASEACALSGALDQLSWIRLHWSWILDPQTEWRTPLRH